MAAPRGWRWRPRRRSSGCAAEVPGRSWAAAAGPGSAPRDAPASSALSGLSVRVCVRPRVGWPRPAPGRSPPPPRRASLPPTPRPERARGPRAGRRAAGSERHSRRASETRAVAFLRVSGPAWVPGLPKFRDTALWQSLICFHKELWALAPDNGAFVASIRSSPCWGSGLQSVEGHALPWLQARIVPKVT